MSKPNHYFLDREYKFISEIATTIGTLIKVHIVDDNPHGFCYNNCLDYQKHNNAVEVINGYYIIMNIEYGVYEFLRHSIIYDGEYKDITSPSVDGLTTIYFIQTESEFYDLNLKMFYLDDEFKTDYKSLCNGEYYVYGLFNDNTPFYIGTHKQPYNIQDDYTNAKIRFKNILDKKFAYDLKELSVLRYNITQNCKFYKI